MLETVSEFEVFIEQNQNKLMFKTLKKSTFVMFLDMGAVEEEDSPESAGEDGN